MSSRHNGPAHRRGGMCLALLCGAVMAGSGASANDDMSSAPTLVVRAADAPASGAATVARAPEGGEDRAMALVCDRLGFMAFVRGLDDALRSPQFPGATVQSAEGLIVLTTSLEIQGLRSDQSSYLTRAEADRWTFTGLVGTEPVADRCTDITADLAGSFRELALAASWGLPEVERRVALFDALEDDLRTRLELAELERDALLTDTEAMRQEMAGLTTELVTARMAVCEIAAQTKGLLTQASFRPGSAPPSGFAELLAEASSLSECIEGTTMTVGTAGEP